MPDELEIASRGPRVFISYSFSNRRIADFTQVLERRGFRPTVVDARTLLGARSLTGAIAGLIREADYVIPLVDAAASNSEWVKKEVELALEQAVPIIPVLDPGVDPTPLFADVPCVLGMDAEIVAERLLEDYVCLDFDPAYPAHFTAAAAVQFMQTDKPGVVDLGQNLSCAVARAAKELFAYQHQGLSEQTLREWRSFQASIGTLEALAPNYRTVLRRFLERWSEPERASLKSWNALTRLIVGTRLMRLIESRPPEDNEGWAELRSGAVLMHEEWVAVTEEDPLTHELLWGVGNRTARLKDWDKVDTSALGSWLLVEAEVHTGERYTIILPDRDVIASGMRLREPPRLYLKSWDWLEFVLPQLAYRGVALSAELGPNMIAGCKLA
jgi:TIR domain